MGNLRAITDEIYQNDGTSIDDFGFGNTGLCTGDRGNS